MTLYDVSGGHWDALLDALPTDPGEVTTDHVRLVLAALEGDVRLLREQRDDVQTVAWATKCRVPEAVGGVIAACRDEGAALALGRARVAAWAWRVGFARYPDLHRILLGLSS